MPYQDSTYGCPVDAGLQVVSGKWKPRILYELFGGTKRFGELHRLIPEVSRHVLTMQLRELERDGMIQRVSYPSIPPKVEYSVTEMGLSLKSVLEPFVEIGERQFHMMRQRDEKL